MISLVLLLNLDTLQQQSQVSVIGMGGVLASVLLVYLLPSYQLAGDVPLAALLTVPGQAEGLPHKQVEMLPNPPS